MSVLTEPEASFLEESDALADIPAPDYRDPLLPIDEGHAAAWLLLKERALARERLTVSDMRRVEGWLGTPPVPDAWVRELADAVEAPGPARDFYGGHTIHLAATWLQRLHDGRLARLVCGFILTRRNMPLVVFHRTDAERLAEAAQSPQATGRLLIEKIRELALCGSCRTSDVQRLTRGLEVDTYRCGGCGVTFQLDWKGLLTAWRAATGA